jgi:hypothetical protein
MKTWVKIVILLVLALGGNLVFFVYRNERPALLETRSDRGDPNVIERTDYSIPPAQEDVLADDRLDDKKPAFDPARVDRRPLGPRGEWLVNASAAVLRLDVPAIKPDVERHLLTLHPSYAAAVQAGGGSVLPSVNLLDGKAKQFDDGLYAALDQAYYQGLEGKLLGHVQLVRRLYDRAGKDSPAAPFLAAGLQLAGVKVEVADPAVRDRLLAEFQADEVASKPIGLYTWNDTLATCFRFLRFFQRQLAEPDLATVRALADALGHDKELLGDYRKAMTFYARLTNPLGCLSVADLVGVQTLDGDTLKRLGQEKKVAYPTVALFPPSTSKETVLFEKLFPLGLPPDADLMRELVRRIRSGEVDLKPKPDSGWYEHQVYALETLLLPERGEERDKLLLTKAYKKRMLEAFQALVTKRRETHVRQLGVAKGEPAAAPPAKVGPRLRVEPCPSYFLRTARAYAFLAHFLEATLGKETLQTLHGLKKEGPRTQNLYAELHHLRDLFYGLYLVSAEDIGLKPDLAKDEPVDPQRCYKLAADFLPGVFKDEDLATDTRVSVPIYVDRNRNVTRLWATLGVRLARLEAGYARPPHLKPAKGAGDWKPVESWQLEPAHYLIAVDEFAEIELKGRHTLTREELRAVCDREKTKEAILQALRK